MPPTWPAIDAPALRHPQRSPGALETIQAPQNPLHTLVVPLSRPWAFDRWLAHFRGVMLPPRTECVAIVDHDSESFYEQVVEGLQTLNLEGLRILWTRRAPLGEWDDLAERRSRITGHWHTFLEAALSETILGAEDDTLPDVTAYPLLLRHIGHGAVFAQGTCIGRWDAGIVPHWTCVEDEHGPLEWHTGTYEGQDVVPIQGGGWYCFAARTEAMRRVVFRAPLDHPVGPDVLACLQLSRLGPCVGDWRVQAIHFCETADLSPNRTVIDRVSFRFERGRWRKSVTAGTGRLVEGREVQIAGSQPRPWREPVGRVVREIRIFGNAPNEVKEFSSR